MKDQEASHTAAIIAAHRAMESSRPAEKRICYDPYAERLIGPDFTVVGVAGIPKETALEMFNSVVPGFHEFFLARTRYLDDFLQRAIEGGLEQLVILGAGYDTRAYRFDGLKTGIRTFEVDHPATQAAKTAALETVFGALPDHVTFVPVDFQHEDLASRLAAGGYDPGLKTLFIWEGVTMYIDAAAVDATLHFVASQSGAGSSVIFDFTTPDVIDGTNPRTEAFNWRQKANASNEPLRFGIATEAVGEFLTERGFTAVECVSRQYFKDAYFVGANADRASTPILAIAHGEVPASKMEGVKQP